MKKSNLENILLLIIAVFLILSFFRKCFDEDNPAVADLPTMNDVKKMNELKSKNGGIFSEMQIKPTTKIQNSGIQVEKYDSILKLLNITKDQVVGLTLFNGKIKDSLSLTRIELDDQKNKVWKWEKTLASGTKIVREMSEKDSVLYENSDIAVAVIDRVEGKGKNAKFFTDFYSLDNNIKFNGGSIFRKENKEIKDFLQFDLNAEFQRSFISPDSRISTDFELSLFPDGRIVPSARIGALTDMNKNLEYFWAVKLKYNLIRIKNR